MKQAYTNTIRGGGGRNPLTIATGAKSKGGGGGGGGDRRGGGGSGKKSNRQKERQAPRCAYGAACTRRGCAYRHPPRGAAPPPPGGSPAHPHAPPSSSSPSSYYENYHDDPRSQICKPYLAGLCTYGARCLNRHPGRAEADSVRAGYKRRPCSYGDDCRTEGCLYAHSWEAKETAAEQRPVDDPHSPAGGPQPPGAYADAGEQICAALNGMALDDGLGLDDGGTGGGGGTMHAAHYYSADAAAMAPPPTYEQWIATGCPPPPTLLGGHAELYDMWHYPGSGMQRNPWEVYSLMHPQQQHGDGTEFMGAGHGWHDANNDPGGGAEHGPETLTYEEWKGGGCPFPAWYYGDDPWYDDQGVRRGFEEVYEVLYGGGGGAEAPASYDPTPAESAPAPRDPTPAESAASTARGAPQSRIEGTPGGGWAAAAARRPDPRSAATNGGTGGRGGGKSRSAGAGGNERGNSGKTVIMPKEIWLPDTANADLFHSHPDPIDRFEAVNDRHKSVLAHRTIPRTFPDSGGGGGSSSPPPKVSLIDVHFQSAKTAPLVLNEFLPPELAVPGSECWIVTGSGRHAPGVGGTHQRREERGVLFNAARRYLDERADSLEYRIGKDGAGNWGAFVVRGI